MRIKLTKEIVAQFGFSEKRWVSRLVKLYRNLLGMREHHKFLLVQILSIYKRAILEEANALVAKGILVRQRISTFFFGGNDRTAGKPLFRLRQYSRHRRREEKLT